MTASDQVRRVQELRRSNAATPVPGARKSGPSADEWDDTDERTIGPTKQHKRLPSRGEVADFLYPIVRRLCREQGFTFLPAGKSKHPKLLAPNGQRCSLPTTLFDGPVRHVYLAQLRKLGADLEFPAAEAEAETVTPAPEHPGMGVALDMPWTDSEWRARQAQAEEWWRQQAYGRAPEPDELNALAAEPVERWSQWGKDFMARLDRLPRSDARSDTWALSDARRMVRDGYDVEAVSRRTGWGLWWLADAVSG